jgi:hypothetical protein
MGATNDRIAMQISIDACPIGPSKATVSFDILAQNDKLEGNHLTVLSQYVGLFPVMAALATAGMFGKAHSRNFRYGQASHCRGAPRAGSPTFSTFLLGIRPWEFRGADRDRAILAGESKADIRKFAFCPPVSA